MVAMNNLKDLLVEQLQDLYNAEGQLVKALPKMVKMASNLQLKEAFEDHLTQTQGHVSRLEEVFEALGEKAKGKTCAAMKGLVAEAQETLEIDDPEVRDAALIAAAQRVEHYEIAGYGTVRTFAEMIGSKEAAELLQETLDEEGAADKKLSELAISTINVQANDGDGAEATTGKTTKRKGESR